MLECIVKQYNVDIQTVAIIYQFADTACTFLVYGHGYIRELLLYLIRLVANHAHWGVLVRQNKSTTLAIVSTTKHSHIYLILKQSDKILHVWSLTRATYGYVAHRYHRHVKRATLQYPHLNQQVPESHS